MSSWAPARRSTTTNGWRPRRDTFEKVGSSLRIFEELNLHTGMNNDELTADLSEKKRVLEWMAKRGIHKVDDVGAIVARYYKDPEAIVSAAAKNLTKDKILPA